MFLYNIYYIFYGKKSYVANRYLLIYSLIRQVRQHSNSFSQIKYFGYSHYFFKLLLLFDTFDRFKFMGRRIEWHEQCVTSVLDLTYYHSQVANCLHNKKYLFYLTSQKKNTVHYRVSLILPYIM